MLRASNRMCSAGLGSHCHGSISKIYKLTSTLATACLSQFAVCCQLALTFAVDRSADKRVGGVRDIFNLLNFSVRDQTLRGEKWDHTIPS